jgi:hypothetical protein
MALRSKRVMGVRTCTQPEPEHAAAEVDDCAEFPHSDHMALAKFLQKPKSNYGVSGSGGGRCYSHAVHQRGNYLKRVVVIVIAKSVREKRMDGTVCCQGRNLEQTDEKRGGPGVLPCGKCVVFLCFTVYPMFQVVA